MLRPFIFPYALATGDFLLAAASLFAGSETFEGPDLAAFPPGTFTLP